jgi:Predicted exporters of the RND superfamily
MFSFLAKLIRHISRFPKAVIAVTALILCLCPYFISNLRWELQLQDILEKEDTVSQAIESIEKSFGGLGSLTVVLRSDDSLANYTLAKNVANQLMTYKDIIHFVEFETDINFYEKYKFFYINNDDLDTIINRVEALRKANILQHNPIFVDLTDTAQAKDSAVTQDSSETSAFANFHLEDIESKYFDRLRRSHSNNDGTVRIIDYLPDPFDSRPLRQPRTRLDRPEVHREHRWFKGNRGLLHRQGIRRHPDRACHPPRSQERREDHGSSHPHPPRHQFP